ncbi:endonuclease-reverse transcriptase [Plakobranchus ocellatus]|uniref:Endonuclease-reverse transcriptase n=1 Tax=Plakobranchus ocellatus TaxID=259542 RepID=A0AAV4BCJ1_9GAST|nr:endonuclease-reverse transcriptase [Plakobranchus ocellatus]
MFELFSFLFTGYVEYDSSHVYRGRRYHISKVHEPFNLAKMNGRCKQHGGYLVQIDDRDEFHFVVGLTAHAKGRGPYYTGITDEESEGHYYTYNDKKNAQYLRWRWFQPDNWHNEDCVSVEKTVFYIGLNDIACGKSGRYILKCSEIRKRIQIQDIVDFVAKQKWKWDGHMARLKDNRWTLRVTEWQARNGKRSRGRQARRWRDDIVKTKGNAWSRDARDRDEWRRDAEGYILQWMDRVS